MRMQCLYQIIETGLITSQEDQEFCLCPHLPTSLRSRQHSLCSSDRVPKAPPALCGCRALLATGWMANIHRCNFRHRNRSSGLWDEKSLNLATAKEQTGSAELHEHLTETNRSRESHLFPGLGRRSLQELSTLHSSKKQSKEIIVTRRVLSDRKTTLFYWEDQKLLPI